VRIDVTERNENDAHLRMLLRELTHRSKNLLAVIQGMARQTARHAGSVGNFLNLFGARLQALAASHDLLVRESWYGASLGELVRSQLASNMERCPEQIAIDGPDVALKPEAAQNLGLALHELAVNAAKYGALSVPDGRLSITWKSRDGAGGGAVDLHWQEQFGPKVKGRTEPFALAERRCCDGIRAQRAALQYRDTCQPASRRDLNVVREPITAATVSLVSSQCSMRRHCVSSRMRENGDARVSFISSGRHRCGPRHGFRRGAERSYPLARCACRRTKPASAIGQSFQ
jgi:two-component sensor histidine kinase